MKINFLPSNYIQKDLLADEIGSGAATTTASTAGAANTMGAISAGSGLIGGIIDAVTANSRAYQQRKFSQEQAMQQRNWALSDRNFALSDAPSMAMAGFKKAGLNPNLIYQQSTNSPVVRSTPEAQYNPATPGIGRAIGSAIGDYQNAKIKSVQTDNATLIGQNLATENLLQHAELIKRGMENNVLSTNPRTEPWLKNQFQDLDLEQEFRKNDLQKQTFENMKAQGINLSLTNESARMSNALQAATQESNITAGLQKGIQALIETSKSQIERDSLRIQQYGLLQDNKVKEAEVALRNGLIDQRSPIYQTFLRSILDAAIIFAK